MPESLVSVIVPTLNAGSGFGRLLRALAGQDVPGEVEIVVIDSSSRDGTAERAVEAGATLLAIPRSRFDHGETRNQAVQAAGGQFVALTVQDAMPVDDSWLAQLLLPLMEQPETAGSYGLQVAPPEADLLSRVRSHLWQRARGEPAVQSLQEWSMSPRDRLEQVRFDNVTACIRRSVWEQIRFPAANYGEDMVWARQALQAGHQIAYRPAARVWHHHDRSWGYAFRRAYLDGHLRAQLVEWPTPDLALSDVWAGVRRMAFFLQTRRFDSLTDPDAIDDFFKQEKLRHSGMSKVKPIVIYLRALEFCRELTAALLEMTGGAGLADGEWVTLMRFAVVAVLGEAVGTTAAYRWPSGDKAWRLIHRLLGRMV